MKLKRHIVLLMGLALMLGCSLPSAALPTATATASPSGDDAATATVPLPTLPPATVPPATATTGFTPIPPPSATSPAPSNQDICSDPAVTTLLGSFKTAVLNSDGPLLASLVSPAHGLDVRFFRYAAPVNYDQEHAKFVFETTFVINWGPQPGSGEDLKGSFHDVIIPPLKAVLSSPATVYACNQIKTGGATYTPEWPYPNIKYYSIFYPGTS
ncbi:MAG TPA: hypothetical protein VGJ22_00325, partial [Anaerolineales bacterium]